MWFLKNSSTDHSTSSSTENTRMNDTLKKNISPNSSAYLLNSISSDGVNLSMTELVNYQNKTSLIDLAARKNIHGQMPGN